MLTGDLPAPPSSITTDPLLKPFFMYVLLVNGPGPSPCPFALAVLGFKVEDNAGPSPGPCVESAGGEKG